MIHGRCWISHRAVKREEVGHLVFREGRLVHARKGKARVARLLERGRTDVMLTQYHRDQPGDAKMTGVGRICGRFASRENIVW